MARQFFAEALDMAECEKCETLGVVQDVAARAATLAARQTRAAGGSAREIRGAAVRVARCAAGWIVGEEDIGTSLNAQTIAGNVGDAVADEELRLVGIPGRARKMV